MRILPFTLLLCFLFAGPVLNASESAARQRLGLSEAGWTQLKSGEAVLLPDDFQSRGFAGGRDTAAAILIDAPVAAVWDVVIDKESAPSFIKDLRRSVVIEKHPDHMVVEQEIKVGHLPGTFTYLMRHEAQEHQCVTFRFLSGDVRDIQGAWEFLPLDGGRRTILIYSLWLDPGFYVPQAFVQKSLRRGVPGALRAIRERVRELEAAE